MQTRRSFVAGSRHRAMAPYRRRTLTTRMTASGAAATTRGMTKTLSVLATISVDGVAAIFLLWVRESAVWQASPEAVTINPCSDSSFC